MRQLKSTQPASALLNTQPRRTALAGFLASAAFLAAALALFTGVFIGGEAQLTPPKEDIVEKLAEHKRQMMRRYARPVELPQENKIVKLELPAHERRQKASLPKTALLAEEKLPEPFPPPSGSMPISDPEVARAISQIDGGNIPGAIETLTAVIKRDPNNEQALVELAMIHLLDLKDPNQAINHLQRVVQINPANQMVMTELVGLYEEQGRLDEGMRYLQDIAQQHPSSPDVSYGLGQLLAVQGRDSEAIPYLERATSGGADQLRAFRDLAEAYSRTGEPERAVEAYSKAVSSLEKDIKEKAALGIPVQYVEEKLNYTKLDIAREMIRTGDTERAQEILDEVGPRMASDDDSVMVLREMLAKRRAG